MVKHEDLVKVRTIGKRHLDQIVAPHQSLDEGSLYQQVVQALRVGHPKVLGWLWNDHDRIKLRNEEGHGEYVYGKKLWLITFKGEVYLVGAPECGPILTNYDNVPQIFV